MKREAQFAGEVVMDEPVIQRESLRALLRVALEDFPKAEQHQRIRSYVRELDCLMDPERAASADPGATLARETAKATGDDVLTLLYKLEDYLESVLVERLARGMKAGP